MAISNATSAPALIPQINTQQVASRRDADGDTDGSKAGEVEKKAATPQQAKPYSATVGTRINTTA
jgi:hypothetical protein